MSRIKQVLTEIEEQIGKEISESETLIWNSFGYNVEDNRLTKLALYDVPLSNIPDPLFELKSLKLLSLVKTNINELPDRISQLQNLEELYLGGTNLNKLPVTIGRLTNLTYLYVYEEKVTELPETLSNCTKLQELATFKSTVIPDNVKKLEEKGCKIVQM